ncbi:MAG: glycosyltransferase family 39 protein [Acidobacteria bacterium]|nr:glycosyltransferase family 39 protein [Acidobacteriota bacterium]
MNTSRNTFKNNSYTFFGFPERIDARQRFLPYALLLAVTFALYATTLYFNFVWDDIAYVERNYRIHGLSLARLWAIWTNTYMGHYAPIQHTFLAILHSFSGLEALGYHLGHLLVHAGCVCLLYFILKKLEAPRVALLASLLFAVYPANIETVAWISETKSTLAFFFFLLSFWFFIRLRERERWSDGILCSLLFILSLLAKVNTIVAPAIFLLYDYKQGFSFKKSRVGSLGWFFLMSAIFTAIHLSAFYASQDTLDTSYYGGLGLHLQNFPQLVLFYIRMVVFPHPLSAWQMAVIYEDFNWVLGVGWCAVLGIFWLLYRSNRSTQFWGLWFFVFLAPVLQIVPFPIWIADRYLYIPAIGMFVLGSKLFFLVGDRFARLWQRLGWEMVMGAVLLAFAWHTQNHLPVWSNNLTLWAATTQTCMTSAYCHNNLGLALLRNGKTEQGVKELIQAVEIRAHPRYLTYLGDAYTLGVKDYRQGLIAYNMALEQGGSYITAEFYSKLARAHYWAGNPDQAIRAMEAGKNLDPNDPSVLVIDGFLKWKQGNLEDARQSLRTALILTGQTSNPAGFLYRFWGDAGEVGRLLSDLRSLPEQNR